jgi:hypothetical protein
MTSKQVMLTVAAMCLGACTLQDAEPLVSPYDTRRVLAVVPLANESGSLHANGAKMADFLARQLENASNIDVLAVNRVIAAMEGRTMSQVTSPADAMRLLNTLGVDGLVVGTITAYDPYEPPKLGLAIELYVNALADQPAQTLNLRQLSRARTGGQVQRPTGSRRAQPYTVVSAFFDAASPDVRRQMQRYATGRGTRVDEEGLRKYKPFQPRSDKEAVHTIHLSMDLFSQFVSYEMCWRLLAAEHSRVAVDSVAQANP